MIPWTVAVRAAIPSPRPQGWQALQMAAGLAETGRPVTLVADPGRPDGGPADAPSWLGSWPASLSIVQPRRPHGPPLTGWLFRRNLARAGGTVLLCRDPRVAAHALTHDRSAAVVHEWHVRPDPHTHAEALRAHWHVAQSAGHRDDLLAAGVPSGRVLLLPNACGLDPDRARARADRPVGEAVVALGLHRRGGLDLALDTWAAHPDLPPLWIVGRDQGGARHAAWSARVEADPGLRQRVRLLGPVWGTAREDLLDRAAAWLCLYPDDDETRTRLSPLQVADALGSGVPVVATDLPSTRAQGDAFFTPPVGGPALASAVLAAITAPRRYRAAPSWHDRAVELASIVENAL